jgi:hypothetical protein
MRSDWCALGRWQLKALRPAISLADDYVLAGNSLMDQVACRVERPGWMRKDEVGEATLAGWLERDLPAIAQASADVTRNHKVQLEARPDANQ